MTKVLTFISLFLCLSCTTTPEPLDPAKNTAVFRYDYDQVWRAAQIALQNYPIRINNSDKGLIVTETLKEGQIWKHPTQTHNSSKRYSLKLRAIKGAIRSKPAIKIVITKKMSSYKNFVEGSKEVNENDFLEENIILYRIKRELIIDHALTKLQQKE